VGAIAQSIVDKVKEDWNSKADWNSQWADLGNEERYRIIAAAARAGAIDQLCDLENANPGMPLIDAIRALLNSGGENG